MVAEGIVPDSPSIVLRTRSGKTRKVPNPFTGGTATVEVMNRTPLANLEEFERRAAKLLDYEMTVHGEGRPRLPPLLIDCDGPYFVGVTCFVSSLLHSTSDSHEEALGNRRVARYGEPFDTPDMTGVFCDLSPNAFCAVPRSPFLTPFFAGGRSRRSD
jgi:hypothetical protein